MKRCLLFAILILSPLISIAATENGSADINPGLNPSPNSGDTASVVDVTTDQPAAHKKPIDIVLGLGLTFGGDTLFSATYTDGSSDSISAGGGLLIYGGFDYHFNDTVSFQSTLGYHFDTTKQASNGSVTFSRIPLELLAYYHVNDVFRLGGGMRIVNSAKLKGDGIAGNVNYSFENTTGLVIESEYKFGPTFGLKLRHVRESYRPLGGTGTFNGNHFGILASLYL